MRFHSTKYLLSTGRLRVKFALTAHNIPPVMKGREPEWSNPQIEDGKGPEMSPKKLYLPPTGFHLENLSRGAKWTQRLGGGGQWYSVPSRGVWGHAPEFFSILDPLRVLLVHFLTI